MNAQSNFWDKKSKSYSKFDGKLNDFQKNFFNILSDFNVNFENKTIVDIGCGTGIYTLNLAKICKNIIGIDSSTGMLSELNKKIEEFKFDNVKTILSSFDDFNTNYKFDIAFLTMSPALNDENDYEKFINLGNLRVYMNWEEPRKSTLLDPFFELYGKKDLGKNRAVYLQNYLESKNTSYQTEILNETRTIKRNFKETCENVFWHLEISGLKFDKNEVKRIIQNQIKDGFINDTVKSKMRILVF